MNMLDSMMDAIFGKFKAAGLHPYIYKKAASGSVYVKFKENLNGTLRIANHKQRSRYAYRWNLRFDIHKKCTKFKSHRCYYFPFSDLDEMVDKMKNWADLNERSAQDWVGILHKQNGGK